MIGCSTLTAIVTSVLIVTTRLIVVVMTVCAAPIDTCKVSTVPAAGYEIAVHGGPLENKGNFRERFVAFTTCGAISPVSLAYSSEKKVCKTNVAWIASAYGCDFVEQLQCAADMFPFSEMESCFLNEI
jgi:hypothetical protein